MVQDPKVQLALALVAGRLHKAQGDKRCGCGPCAHRVALAARHAGIPRERLLAALPPAAKPESRRPRQPRHMHVRICESGSIRVRGRDVEPQEGVAVLLRRLHSAD